MSRIVDKENLAWLCQDRERLTEQMATLELRLAESKRRVAELQQSQREWIKENAPGGWIDNLRRRLAESQSLTTHWATKATEQAGENKPLRERVKRLEDALAALYDDCCKGGFYITQKVEAVVDKALAAKEPTA